MRIAVKNISNNLSFAAAMWLGVTATVLAQPTLSQPARAEKESLQNVSTTTPQTVYVAVSKAEVFAGPAEDAYPTSYVERGNALEVYHRTQSGWLGIRPPEKSFSWVPAGDAYLLPGGRVIEITQENTVSWIGTELGSAKQYRWQVKLNTGEQLAVLGERTMKDENGGEVLWYKVAPPSGEFRWIHEKAVSTTAVVGDNRNAASTSGAKQPTNASPKSSVRRASAVGDSQRKKSAVEQADFTQDVFADEQIIYDSGEMIDGGYIDGGYVDGGYIEGQYIEGQYIGEGYIEGQYVEGQYVGEGYVDGDYTEAEVYQGKAYVDGLPVRSSNSFHGWHALELTDEGFRSPFLERRYRENQARAAYDPLNHDPFDLSMAKKPSPAPRPEQVIVHNGGGASPKRRNTPWRDPRSLRQNRLNGYPADRLSSNDAAPTEAPAAAPAGLLGQLASSVTRLTESTDNATPLPRTTSVPSGPAAGGWFGVNQTSSPHGASGASGIASNPSVDLNDVQVQLSQMVSQPMQSWNLAPLLTQTQTVIEQGATPLERGQARLLLERIEEFEQLARKSGFGSASVMTASLTGAPASSIDATTASYQTKADPLTGDAGFDATGWLVPVHAAAVGQPTHAITNDAGQTIAYVSGLPGMNLARYVNQPVGITGLRGYLPALQANHIQAQRVVRLR